MNQKTSPCLSNQPFPITYQSVCTACAINRPSNNSLEERLNKLTRKNTFIFGTFYLGEKTWKVEMQAVRHMTFYRL